MPITLYPANAVSGAPSYSGRMLRQALGVLLGGGTTARPLGGRSGVRPGTSGLGSATATTWTVNPHAGALDLETSTAAGPYLYSVDDQLNTGTVTAADATNPRIDLVYVTLNDPAESDGSSTPGAVFGYLAGTPAASPSAPATPARSMALFTISVPKSGSGSPTTADVAPFTAAAGAPVPVRSVADRNAMAVYDGLCVRRLDLPGRPLEVYDASVPQWWTNSVQALSYGANFGAPPAGYSSLVLAVSGKIAMLAGHASWVTGTGGGLVLASIPAPYWPAYDVPFSCLSQNNSNGASGSMYRGVVAASSGVVSLSPLATTTQVPANVIPVQATWLVA